MEYLCVITYGTVKSKLVIMIHNKSAGWKRLFIPAFFVEEKKGDGIRERPAKEKIAKILFLNRRY